MSLDGRGNVPAVGDGCYAVVTSESRHNPPKAQHLAKRHNPLATQAIAEHTMAKIKPMDLVKSMSGKICEHSDISFAKRGDTQYTVKRCNERDLEKNPYTEAELAHQAKFKSVAASTAARVKTNDPEDVAAFKAQKKYKTFRSYIWAQEWANYTAD